MSLDPTFTRKLLQNIRDNQYSARVSTSESTYPIHRSNRPHSTTPRPSIRAGRPAIHQRAAALRDSRSTVDAGDARGLRKNSRMEESNAHPC